VFLIHIGDLHGGNLMAADDGTLAVFDAGYVPNVFLMCSECVPNGFLMGS
jgi:hypothetical protein